MFTLVRKDFLMVYRHVLTPIALLVLFIYLAPQEVLFGSFMRNLMVFVVGMTATWALENNEEKQNGYTFLSTLPIPAASIVRSKYFIVALLVSWMILVNTVVVHIFFKNPENIHNATVILIYFAGLTFCYAGINLLGMMKFGCTKVFGFSMGIIFFTLGYFNVLVLPEGEFIQFLASLSQDYGLIFLGVSILVYLGTMFLSEKVLAGKLGQNF